MEGKLYLEIIGISHNGFQVCESSTCEAEAGGLLSSRQAWAALWILGQARE